MSLYNRLSLSTTIRLFFIAGLAGMADGLCAATAPEIERTPAPPWVDWLPVDPAAEFAEGVWSQGLGYLVDDRQIHVAESTAFRHGAMRLFNLSGVEAGSRLSFSVDPSHETLRLHLLQILRGGQVIDLLETQNLRVRQRESNLEWNLYDGRWEVEALLEGTRPGDVIEWAVSVEGFNPILDGLYTDIRGLYFAAPVRHYRHRVILPDPNQRLIQVRLTGDAPEPTKAIMPDGSIDWQIVLRDVEETDFRGDTPAWFDEIPVVEFSEFASWRTVAEWAEPLYRQSGPLPAVVAAETTAFREIAHAPGRISAALRYVQDTIRYVSNHAGLHSHMPYPLADVARWRFGDCKDKAVMLCAVLYDLGINAWPALVNTSDRHRVAERLPSAYAFDHVIVAVELADRLLFVDPTMRHQRGPLTDIFLPPYGVALILRPGEEALHPVTGSGFERGRLFIRETFVLPDEADDPVRLEVESLYEGFEADFMRSVLDANSPRSLQRQYGEFYASEHRSAEAAGDLTVDDDEALNRITMREFWTLPNPWHRPTDGGFPALRINPTFIRAITSGNAHPHPPRPVALAFPKKLEHEIIVQTPFEVGFPEDADLIETDSFRFTFFSKAEPLAFTLRYAYEARRDHLAAETLSEDLEALAGAHDWTFFEIYHPWSLAESGAFVPHWPIIGLFFLLFAFGIALGASMGFWPVRAAPDRKELLETHPELDGVRGWLVLPFIGLGFTLIYSAASLFMEDYWLLDRDVWEEMTSPTLPDFHPLVEPLVLLEIGFLAFLLGLIPLLMVQFLCKRAAVRLVMPAFYLLNVPLALVSLWLLVHIGGSIESEDALEGLGDLVRILIACLIWIPYFIRSRRARITFHR